MTPFESCIINRGRILMEGAYGERLKREYTVTFDPHVDMTRMIEQEEGRRALTKLNQEYAGIAKKYGLPFMVTPTSRRADYDRMQAAGCRRELLRENIAFVREVVKDCGTETYVGGLLGNKGNAYTGEGAITSQEEARRYHAWQAEAYAEAGADFLMAGIMPTIEEVAGMAQALGDTGLPYIISFALEDTGCLVDGTRIADAIAYIDKETGASAPLCYITNCVHPSIVYRALEKPFNRCDLVYDRFWGVQANASPLSFKELDNSIDLKSSEPAALGRSMERLKEVMDMRIFGGCCGTDGRHMEKIAKRLSKP